MAKAKTGSFYLTERVTLTAAAASGTNVQGTIDLGAYLNIPSGQCIAVESCDFIWQTTDGGGDVGNMIAGNGALGAQVTDLNPGTGFIFADDHSLIASGSMNIDQSNNVATAASDFYPDNFGPSALSEHFMVVNDTLYFTIGVDGAAVGGVDVSCCLRCKVRVVKLQQDDWVAIALRSTAADN